MLDQALAARIANAVARGDGAAGRGPAPSAADLAAICADAQERVVAYTGLRPASALPAPEAVQRSDWIAANVASMDAVLGPVGDRIGAGLGALGAPAKLAASKLVSAEAGALTGYLSQRVLGQYEFVVVEPRAPARLLFVAPNLAKAATRLDADPDELLRWIAFHEVTHAVQFSGVPWLRGHLAGLVRELIASLDVTLGAGGGLPRPPSASELRELAGGLRRSGIVALLGAGRRELLERIQAVMGVVEGHAEHVMDVVGAQALPSLAALREGLDRRRRERPPLLALLERLIGLDAKLRQYEDGKRFCDAVVAHGGAVALHRVFDEPAALPSAAELQDAAAWLRRMGAEPAAGSDAGAAAQDASQPAA